MHDALEIDMGKMLDWFEVRGRTKRWLNAQNEPSLWVAIVTGKGRAFCAGQDLEDWRKRNAAGTDGGTIKLRPNGFGSISRRYFTCVACRCSAHAAASR